MSLWNNINILLKIFQISTLQVWRSTSISSSSWCRWASHSPRTRRPPPRPGRVSRWEQLCSGMLQSYQRISADLAMSAVRLWNSQQRGEQREETQQGSGPHVEILRVRISTSVKLILNWGSRWILIAKRAVLVSSRCWVGSRTIKLSNNLISFIVWVCVWVWHEWGQTGGRYGGWDSQEWTRRLETWSSTNHLDLSILNIVLLLISSEAVNLVSTLSPTVIWRDWMEDGGSRRRRLLKN